MTELELIIQDLDGIGTELFNKYGTESYNMRCKLHDIKDQLKAINHSQCCKKLPSIIEIDFDGNLNYLKYFAFFFGSYKISCIFGV